MKRLAMVVAVLTMLVAGVYAQDQARLLKTAMNTQNVDGNLKLAIEQYRKASEGSDRAITAQALLGMAECYQKLGNAEAQRTYERIVKDFADQPDAVRLARAKLGGPGSGVASRQVWTPSTDGSTDVFGNVSSDGRYVAYTNYAASSDLFLRDLTTKTSRRLTNHAGSGEPLAEWQAYTFSRDGRQLAYSWLDYKTNLFAVRVVGLQNSGAAADRALFSGPDGDVVVPYDWSPDGKWIAIGIRRADRSGQIGLVSSENGSLRVVKQATWDVPLKMFFSPDGKHLAFDLPRQSNPGRDVFILRVSDLREIPAPLSVGENDVVGWSPDGRRLLFTSDRAGSTSLWAVSFVDGDVRGNPELIRRTVEGGPSMHPMGITEAGALYSAIFDRGVQDIYTATFDFAEGRFASLPAAVDGTGGTRQPRWSLDGKSLAYRSRNVMAIRNMATGEVRELPFANGYRLPGAFSWTASGDGLVLAGTDPKGRNGLFRMDARTGELSLIAEGRYTAPATSSDGRFLYYRRYDQPSVSFAFLKRDLVAGTASELVSGLKSDVFALSPDGRFLATTSTDASTGTTLVRLIPTTSGEPRELLRAEQPLAVLMWAPDSRSVFIRKASREVWRVPLESGQPRKTDLLLDPSTGFFQVHPDGRQVALQMSGSSKPTEIWVLEHFLPVENRK